MIIDKQCEYCDNDAHTMKVNHKNTVCISVKKTKSPEQVTKQDKFTPVHTHTGNQYYSVFIDSTSMVVGAYPGYCDYPLWAYSYAKPQPTIAIGVYCNAMCACSVAGWQLPSKQCQIVSYGRCG